MNYLRVWTRLCLAAYCWSVTLSAPTTAPPMFEELAQNPDQSDASKPSVQDDVTTAKPSTQDAMTKADVKYAQTFLQQYGFIQQPSEDDRLAALAVVNMTKALKRFQRMAGLPQTGMLNDETLVWMKKPRCGVKDTEDEPRRMKRAVLQGSKWNKSHLTYKVTDYTDDMTHKAVDEEIRRAVKIWADETNLRFSPKVQGKEDINIRFAERAHGDHRAFDGPGGTFAHAFFPAFGGAVHLDDAETYTYNTTNGTNLLMVVAHELGHSLGLRHARSDPDALMAPFYRGYTPDLKLNHDDILGIQALYGPPTSATPPPAATTPTSTSVTPSTAPSTVSTTPLTTALPSTAGPSHCEIGPVDAAVFRTSNSRSYLFSGEYYWRLNDYGVDRGFPRRISTEWKGLPGSIDAAVSLRNNDPNMYFFKGHKYWKFTDGVMQPGYPKQIGVHGFLGLPANIDSAFVWSGNGGKIYFTKDDLYYRISLDGSRRSLEKHSIDKNYPITLGAWRGLPSSVGAAFQWRNRKTYFFHKSKPIYYRFNDGEFKVDDGYPKSVARYWLLC